MKRKPDEPKGSPAWMNTFADLMNLLLCFFVLLFSMSTVDAEKFEKMVASFQNTFSILPNGGSSIGDGTLISSGVSQLEMLDSYYKDKANSETDQETDEENDVVEEYKEQALEESEKMSEQLEDAICKNMESRIRPIFSINWLICSDACSSSSSEMPSLSIIWLIEPMEVDFNAQYVMLNMNGALLFDSGHAEIRSEAYPLIDKLGKLIEPYQDNIIEVEGHTDNVPIHSAKYEDNDVLSFYRARAVTDYLRDITTVEPAHLKASGRGEYVPVADNTTQEGRARNRRVIIKIYNSYSSDFN